MDQAQALLSSVFGFQEFRVGQRDIIDAVAADKNVLAIMPTGGGKSLCFQLPALMRDGVTVVISPLIALMNDQVMTLNEAGIRAGSLTSNNSQDENQSTIDALRSGELKLLYMAPERLASGGTLSLLRASNVSAIAVDEAHCVAQWGHDFRPDYLRIGALRDALDVPLCAFTATADEDTRAEMITRLFGDRDAEVFIGGFDRPNLHLRFCAKQNPRQQILKFADEQRGLSGIVYCASRAKTEKLASALRDEGHAAVHYHGGMEPDARRHVEDRFKREDSLIVTATIAFGMGIDRPDIRWVAHADLPKSVESYYQEIGRAGRDGAPASTLTLFGPDDIRLRRAQIDESPSPLDRRAADHQRLNLLLGLAQAQKCRRVNLLAYFDEAAEPCGFCDLCDTPPELFDGTELVRKALSAVMRCEQRFGASHIIDVLTGQNSERARQWGHDQLSVFGLGKSESKAVWRSIFSQMLGADLLRADPARHGALYMTKTAEPILRGENQITLRKDLSQPTKRSSTPTALVQEEDAPLLSALKGKRKELAQRAGVPAFVVFADRTLIEMAQGRPQNFDEMARISGVGAKKLERYGDAFLSVIMGESAAKPHPHRMKLAAKGSGEISPNEACGKRVR